jgi:hypothetical protein
MSKWTSYDKIYHIDDRFVPTTARVYIYPADVFLPTDGLLPSVLTIKKCVHADGLMRLRGHKCVCADTSASAQIQARPRERAHASVRTQARLRGRDHASART